jgi:hypothetical protein
MHNIWDTIEIDCLARDFDYKQYLEIHAKTEQIHKHISWAGYRLLNEFFYVEMLNDYPPKALRS